MFPREWQDPRQSFDKQDLDAATVYMSKGKAVSQLQLSDSVVEPQINDILNAMHQCPGIDHVFIEHDFGGSIDVFVALLRALPPVMNHVCKLEFCILELPEESNTQIVEAV